MCVEVGDTLGLDAVGVGVVECAALEIRPAVEVGVDVRDATGVLVGGAWGVGKSKSRACRTEFSQ